VGRAHATRARFGTTPAGQPVAIVTLTNARELVVRATNYGGIIVSLLVPDRDGRLSDVVLGYDSLDGYLAAARLRPSHTLVVSVTVANTDLGIWVSGKTFVVEPGTFRVFVGANSVEGLEASFEVGS